MLQVHAYTFVFQCDCQVPLKMQEVTPDFKMATSGKMLTLVDKVRMYLELVRQLDYSIEQEELQKVQ